MPRPRFDKLAPEVRARILQAAAQEFGENNYADASLNRVIELAGISKGSLYYYFDDKEDLFGAVMTHLEEQSDGMFEPLPADTTAENYWDKLAEHARLVFRTIRENPWIMAFGRLFHDTMKNPPSAGPLAECMRKMHKARADVVQRGQELGVVRTDLPLDLLLTVIEGMDQSVHPWMAQHWNQLTEDQREALGMQMLDLKRRVMQQLPGETRAVAAGAPVDAGDGKKDSEVPPPRRTRRR
ncbi:MAG TPA: TetR/AcrR family transcriptional regulator [Pseudomonadota bacterium]|nr:TetR/AcrR family transcriptional regulator [Pseudomonadota bacterium]